MKKEVITIGRFASAVLIAVAGLAANVSAQEAAPAAEHQKREVERTVRRTAPEPGERLTIERHIQEGGEVPLPKGDFVFLSTEMNFGSKVVKNSPYSAQAVTEHVQTLNDGNRIVHKSTASLFRDSEGRTRREQTLKAIGPFATSADTPQTIFINDPVAGTSYTLDSRAKVARKMPPMRFKIQKRGPEGEGKPGVPAPGRHEAPGEFHIEVHPGENVMVERKIEGEAGQKKVLESGVRVGWVAARNENARTEPLGKQVIEGVEAEGTRTIVTIPAGEIGNERAIEIVSERWYSQELQTTVMTRHSDPRFGENSYRLTNISRTEPARSLFEVPADYTVKEAPVMHPGPMRMRTPMAPPQ